MKKSTNITIGISAYNEENNIKNILRALLSQKKDSWTLEKIIVNCDGCTDNTVKKIEELNVAKIQIIDNKERKGKAQRIGEIFNLLTSEILVLFDADITLKDTNVINNLLSGFNSPDVALVGGNTKPLSPDGFFEKSVYSTFIVFEQSRLAMKNGNNVFGCTGGCMALTKQFAKAIKFPTIMTEDDFIYFSCLKLGYTFKYVQDARAYYKLPKNIKDYLRQNFRSNPHAIILNLQDYFGTVVEQEYTRPRSFYFKSILKAFLTYPLETMYICFINLICLPFFPLIAKQFKLEWFTAQSTK